MDRILVAGEAGAAQPNRREQTIELLVFLFLIVPSLAASLFVRTPDNLSFTLTAVSTIFRDISLVCLIAFFLWRNGEPRARIGWRLDHILREAGIGSALFIPLVVGSQWLERALVSLGLSIPHGPERFLTPQGPAQLALAGILVAVVAVSEETIFRGYVMLRLSTATRSLGATVLLSTVIFAMGHGYEGSAGLVTVGAIGGAFALVYLWRGSLVAPIVMHFCLDFLGIVIVPLAGVH